MTTRRRQKSYCARPPTSQWIQTTILRSTRLRVAPIVHTSHQKSIPSRRKCKCPAVYLRRSPAKHSGPNCGRCPSGAKRRRLDTEGGTPRVNRATRDTPPSVVRRKATPPWPPCGAKRPGVQSAQCAVQSKATPPWQSFSAKRRLFSAHDGGPPTQYQRKHSPATPLRPSIMPCNATPPWQSFGAKRRLCSARAGRTRLTSRETPGTTCSSCRCRRRRCPGPEASSPWPC